MLVVRPCVDGARLLGDSLGDLGLNGCGGMGWVGGDAGARSMLVGRDQDGQGFADSLGVAFPGLDCWGRAERRSGRGDLGIEVRVGKASCGGWTHGMA